mmetsp:Transcript_22211/g.38002  ORF Transcript_22211/g.38002 Transcript_22211/m.38002 type:complete len:262 (-) Transcript_22211:671-1456(-)|eukprot:CAMPEP_0119108226 /NCGR_PEP_ID=MMETSP1180-20130426/13536_1 /TAXON_ID=3052 ORGANISM="Chlamydomonas cf sp, Strain CCMP681" /NCGR_SAMPLE_ID=MMETSP1180 /ASSEMBLY_ACC=CAM_ASM_000741 /LENGTH=261 /DNA_ID=CAMNT_0007093817 /DNA_START=34 /DNA_END=819 /DNA_ORIENTATION=-
MTTTSSAACNVLVGVLALQGSFREHMTLLQRLPGVDVIEVRSKEELASVAGLIIPGGESTTMANIAERWGLIPELRGFAQTGKPIWGTCAGMIFLAERAEGQKEGGQALLGGLDIKVSRNFFGAQINSFETMLPAAPEITQFGGEAQFRAMFIRAPAVLEMGPSVQALATYKLTEEEQQAAQGRSEVVVAVRSGVLLATAFHPELTTDTRWHQLFVDMVRKHTLEPQQQTTPDLQAILGRPPNRPVDMPVYGKEHMRIEAL